jgi:hypothetical protein
MNRLLTLLLLLCSAPALAADLPFRGCFDIASRQHSVPMDLLLAVAAVESNWDASARSSNQAHGIMQIRWPLTARHLGAQRVAELYNPCLNIDMGARYLSELTDHYGGNETLALAAYNYGPTRIQSHADVPRSVLDYVERVQERRGTISQNMGRNMARNTGESMLQPVATSKGLLEVAEFDHTDRARRFSDTLQRFVPGASLQLESRHGRSIVLIDQTHLTTADRYRLSLLLPDVFEPSATR